MQSINFSDGYKTYAINGDENNVIKVNVTDINILSRMKSAMAKCEEGFEEFSRLVDPTPEQLNEADMIIRAIIDEAFGADVSSHAFGGTNCLSPVSNGKPICVAFLEAFMPIITSEIKSTMQVQSVAIEDKTAKYTQHITQPALTDEQKAFMEFLATKNNGAIK